MISDLEKKIVELRFDKERLKELEDKCMGLASQIEEERIAKNLLQQQLETANIGNLSVIYCE
jgi:hypothetical protein